MQTALSIGLMVTSILLTMAILLQAQGSGLGSAWSGGGETYHTKRGVEKVVFIFTIIAIIIFTVLAVANLVVRR